MLTQEKAIEKLEALKPDLAKKIVIQLKEQGLYSNLPNTQIEQTVLTAIEGLLGYFRTGDLTALKAEIKGRSEKRIKSGNSLEEIQKVIAIVAKVIEQGFEEIAEGEEGGAAIVARFKQRSESIKALNQVSVVNAKLKEGL